jgi:DNA-binding CsgD family transcriptional regulator
VPVGDFLAFHDELVGRFYPDGKKALLELGAEAARWAHVDGPLKHHVSDPDIAALLTGMKELWHVYFPETESRCEVTLTDQGLEYRVYDLPAWHPYFEHLVVGYQKELLGIYCANPVSARRQTGGRGRAYAYLLSTDPLLGVAREEHATRRPRPLRAQMPITKRELEVLRLVSASKTNREIAFLLGISERTVEHHITHAYDKLGLYTRVGAASWLAEKGLAG